MMRTTETSRSEAVRRFRLEGRLTQTTAGDLLAAITPLLTAGGTVLLDLAGITFADRTAIDALLSLRARGVVLAGGSSFLVEMLRADATAPPESAPVQWLETDASLLARLRGGDAAAFEELVERTSPRLLATARRLLRNDDEARDVVQEAFLSAFRGLAAFHGGAKLSTWLHRITVNAALMRLRSRRQRAESSIDELLPRFDEQGEWLEESGRLAQASDELLARRETRLMVRRCIDQLPDSYRTILLMRDIDDLDTDEAAAALGITPNAAKIRLHRARQALRTLVETELRSEPGMAAVADAPWSAAP